MARPLSPETKNLIISKIPDFDKLSDQEAEARIVMVIANDFYIYCERNLFIEDKDTTALLPLIDVLNWQQRTLVDMILTDLVKNVPVRYIILKARQMGISTVIEGLCLWWTATHKHVHSLIMAHESDSNDALYAMFKRFYDNCHNLFQPTKKYNNRKELVFDIEDKVKDAISEHIANCDSPETCGVSHVMPGLDSSIKTMVARPGKGRSMKHHFLHGSEVAFWEGQADVASSAIQTVPDAPNTFIFLESTANGVGGYFYDTWQAAKRGESNFKPIFFAWHEHEKYEIEGSCYGHYNDEELELLEIFEEKGYPKDSWDRKILWRRRKQKDFVDDPKKFYQEYPKDDMEAFISSGRPRFDLQMLVKMENYAIKNESHRFGQIVPNPDERSLDRYVFEEIPKLPGGKDPSPLKVWELPVKNVPGQHRAKKYFIGVDVSEGKINAESKGKENDYAVVDVMDEDRKTVARWRGHIDPDLLGSIVNSLGIFYNTALVGVEVNNHGLTTVQSLRNKGYPNLFMRKTSEEQAFQELTSNMGWRTDKKTKKIIIDKLAQAIREGDIIDLDVVFIRECTTYVRDDQGYTNAQSGCFDDTVMAKAIALKMSDYDDIDVKDLREKVSKRIKRNNNASNSNTAELESIATGHRRQKSNSEVIERRRAARNSRKRLRGT